MIGFILMMAFLEQDPSFRGDFVWQLKAMAFFHCYLWFIRVLFQLEVLLIEVIYRF
jgi:hypothetical protein